MTRILITGGCGFIGSNLVEYLIKKTDWTIIILDNLSSGNKEDVVEIEGFSNRGKIFVGDITNKNQVAMACKGCDYIVNLAAQTSVINSTKNPYQDAEVNIIGLINILGEAVRYNVKKVIQASSAAVIGVQGTPINESKIPSPVSPYGASKLAGEAYCSAFVNSYGLKCVGLRFSNVYGPRSYHKGSVIPKFIKGAIMGKNLEIYGTGEQTRDFIFVDDISFGIFKAIINNTNNFELIQLGTGKETSINMLIKILLPILEQFDLPIPKLIYSAVRSGEIMKSYCDIKKAINILDFKIKIPLEIGLSKTLEWFKENKYLIKRSNS